MRNYVSLLAESLGVAEEDRYRTLRRLGDADAVARASAPQWRSHGWREEQARAAAERHLVAPRSPATDNG